MRQLPVELWKLIYFDGECKTCGRELMIDPSQDFYTEEEIQEILSHKCTKLDLVLK